MYQPSENFLTELNKTSRLFRARITCGTDTLTEEIKKMIFTLGSCGADTFTIGSVFASYVDITLSSIELSLTGKEMFIEIGLLLPDDAVEYIPMGYFTASPADISRSRDQTILKATDRISSKCGGLYIPSINFPATIQAVMNDVSTQAGITIKTSLPTTGVIQKEMKNLTYREILGCIAGLLGGFCYADKLGNICIAAYPSASSLTIENERSWTMEMGEEYSVGSLKVIVSEGGEDADGNEVAGVSYSAGSGNGITVSNQYMTESLFNDMKSRVLNYSFCSGTARVLGDPRLDPSDAITVINFAGKDFFVPCMSIIQEYDGGLSTTITTPGQAVSDDGINGPITQQVERLAAEMVMTKEVVAKKLTADQADLRYVTAEIATIMQASIDELSAEQADFENLTTKNFNAVNGELNKLSVDTLNARYIQIDMGNIDVANINKATVGSLLAEIGLITTAVIQDGHVTGSLDSVEVNANSIKAGTLSVDRLIINGSDKSIIYAINNAGELESQSVDTIDGGVLTERTVTADKIVAHSITSTEITTENIMGSNGWINLSEATFNYGGKIIFDGKNLYIDAESLKAVLGDYYSTQDDVVNRLASIKSDVENIDLEVSQLSSQNGFSVGNVLQNYEGYDIPTLHNYPTFTDFFIWDVCSDTMYCQDDLICGTNDYASHAYDVYKSTKYNRYYAFKQDENGVYYWVQLTAAEYEILSSQYSSVKVDSDGIWLYSAQNENSAYLDIKPDGVRASKIYCC